MVILMTNTCAVRSRILLEGPSTEIQPTQKLNIETALKASIAFGVIAPSSL